MIKIRCLLAGRVSWHATIGGAVCAVLVTSMWQWSVAAHADVPPAPTMTLELPADYLDDLPVATCPAPVRVSGAAVPPLDQQTQWQVR